jgi:hypothetical protein
MLLRPCTSSIIPWSKEVLMFPLKEREVEPMHPKAKNGNEIRTLALEHPDNLSMVNTEHDFISQYITSNYLSFEFI